MGYIPNTNQKIYEESLQFRGPISESALQQVGGAVNYLLDKIVPIDYLLDVITPIGTMLYSVAPNETVFQGLISPGNHQTWVLADGRDVTGSGFHATFGATHIPDLRGVFVRGKNFGRPLADGNPDGDVSCGTYQADDNKTHYHIGTTDGAGSHQHNYDRPTTNNAGPSMGAPQMDSGTARNLYAENKLTDIQGAHTHTFTTSNAGISEARPRNATMAAYIRID